MLARTGLLNSQTAKQSARFATAALAAIAYFVAIIVALHFLRPEVNPISRPTSEYAVGPYGFLMTSAFFSMSVACWALVLGLYQGLPQPARSRLGLGLLGMWALGVLIAMIFPTDVEGAPQTVAGTIHRMNGPLAFFSLTLGVLLVSLRFKRDETWHPFHRPALILSAVMLVEFIAVPAAMATESGLAGLAQMFFLVTFVIWFVLMAARLRAAALRSR